MEAVLLQYSSPDQSISPYKQHTRNPKCNHPALISRPFENFAPPNFRGGVLYAPPPSLSFSYPPPFSCLNPQQQPPLLPLPIGKPNQNSRSRGLSCPPINRKINNSSKNRTRDRDQSLTPKKSKPSSSVSPKKEDSKRDLKSTTSSSVSPKKGDSKRDLKSTTSSSVSPKKGDSKRDFKSTTNSRECLIVASTNPLGPDPKDLPKDVSRVLTSSSSGNYSDLEKFSGSVVFTLSPPPSSLPLPTFSLRPKLCCNAEAAAGIDAGATDNLRRLLRLP